MSNYAFDRKPYMPTTSSCLVGPRAESISMSCEQWFEVVGYMARPGRVSSFEAEIPKDGRDKVFENLFPGQVYRPIELGDTPSGLPNKLGAQFRINFGHPNFRDGKLVKYNEGKPNFWKKEHQVKIFANEFLAVGFNIQHKQEALEKYSEELLEFIDPAKTHKFYWEKPIRRSVKPHHPGENDPYLPEEIRGQHFDSWTDLAKVLGYGE